MSHITIKDNKFKCPSTFVSLKKGLCGIRKVLKFSKKP